MTDILQILYYVFTIFMVFPLGFSIILLSKREQENWIPKSFLYGTAFLIIGSYWISYFCEKGLRNSGKVFIAISLICSIVVFLTHKCTFLQYLKNITRKELFTLLLCCCLGALPLILIVIYGAVFPYCDGYTYICIADYLMDYGYTVAINPEDTLLHPWLSQMLLYQALDFRIGAQMFLALFAGFFNVTFSVELFMPITSYGVFLCGMSSWMYTSKKYTESPYYKAIAIILIVINVPIIVWNAVYGFLPQTFGSAYFIAAIAAILDLREWKNDQKWSILTTSLLFSCQALSYNEMLPFLVLVTLVLCLRLFIQNKNERKQIVIYMFSCALLAMIFIITFVPGMIKSTLSQFGAIVGWHQDKDLYTYIGYCLSTIPAEYSFRTTSYSMSLYFFQLLTIVLFCVVILGLCKSEKEIKKEYFFISLPYVLIMIYFALFTENPFIGGKGNSWSIYKLVQYYFVAAIPYLAIFISEIVNKFNKKVVYISLSIFIVFNGKNAINYMEQLSYSMEGFVGKEENSILEYYKLYDEYGKSGQRISLYNVPDKHRQMVTYFLKDVELVSDWKSDGYYAIMPEVPDELMGTGIEMTYDLTKKENVAGLVECDAVLVMGEGFYNMETAEDSFWNWSQKESSISIVNDTLNEELLLNFEVFGLETNKVELVTVYSEEGQLLQSVEIVPNKVTSATVKIPKGVKKISFIYNGDTQSAEGDPRELAFAFRNYDIKAVE